MSPKKLISVRVSPEAADNLALIAAETGKNQTDLIETAIQEIVKKQEYKRISDMENSFMTAAQQLGKMLTTEERKEIFGKLSEIRSEKIFEHFVCPIRTAITTDIPEFEEWDSEFS